MDINNIIDKFKEKPYMLDMGALKLASWLKVTPEEIREAKKIVRKEKTLAYVNRENLEPHKTPRILLLDIETAPLKAYVWRLWKQDIYLDQLISDWFMLTWAAKWLLEPGVMSQKLTREEALEENDFRIVETLWYLLDQADIVIAHNGSSFDIPKIKSRFVVHGLSPTSYYQQIDTKNVARKEFGFSSNKLDALATIFGIENKIHTGFKLWADCLEGNEEALLKMEEYNKHDVEILEEVYINIRPYIKGHPNYNLYIDSEQPVCPNCGGKHLDFVGYYYFTQSGKYKNYRCLSCGALARERKSVFKNSKNILISNGK